jgi:RecA-family ATPase
MSPYRSPEQEFEDLGMREAPPTEDAPKGNGTARNASFKTIYDFCSEYTPLSYVIDPIVRSSSLYALTARTGAGKTALLVPAALAIAKARQDPLGMEVSSGCVAYLAFENPDDVRMRFMMVAHRLNIDLRELGNRLVVCDRRSKPEDLVAKLTLTANRNGPFSLVVLDTFAGGFDGKDINDNVQSGEFTRRSWQTGVHSCVSSGKECLR